MAGRAFAKLVKTGSKTKSNVEIVTTATKHNIMMSVLTLGVLQKLRKKSVKSAKLTKDKSLSSFAKRVKSSKITSCQIIKKPLTAIIEMIN